jgi:fumarate reductase subunit D
VLALLVAFLITAGLLPTIQLGRIDAFVPAYATALFVIDLMTAILLFAHRAFACAALALSGSREPIVGYGRIFGLKLPASI